MARQREPIYINSEIESFREQPLIFKIAIVAYFTIILVASVGLTIFAFVQMGQDYSEVIWIIAIILAIILFAFGLIVIVPLKMRNRKYRKRRKQIREAGLDQLDEGEQAISPEELEERYNQRQAQRQAMTQNNGRRRPPIVLLNERPSNEFLLKKMVFKGKITGEKCSICKLDLRKKQTIVQCPKCLALFHYDHLNNWFEKNNDCPVCDEFLIEN